MIQAPNERIQAPYDFYEKFLSTNATLVVFKTYSQSDELREMQQFIHLGSSRANQK